MASHSGRPNAQTLPEASEGIFDHEDGRLGNKRVLKGNLGRFFISSLRIDKLTKISAEMRFQEFAAMINDGAKERLSVIEVTTHVDVLSALATEQENERGIAA